VAGLFVATLPPGPSLLTGPVRHLEDEGPTGAAGIYAANEGALSWAAQRLHQAERRQGLHQLIPAGATPVVARFDSAGRIDIVRDQRRTAAAESLWKRLPRAADAPRMVLFGTFRMQPAHELTEFTNGLCIAPFAPVRGPDQFALRRHAGACAFAYQFGPPGVPMRAWLGTVGQVAFPDAPRTLAGRGVVQQLDVWSAYDRWRGGPDLGWSLSRQLEACAGGRRDQCTGALGFSPEDARAAAPWPMYRGSGSTADLPAALLADIGPERFRIIWRGADPIPEAYHRLTGRSFDLWAMNYVQDAVGRLDKENGLSLLGWTSWLLWMGLLVGWFAVRVERRSAT
jgi:hypothetical protein